MNENQVMKMKVANDNGNGNTKILINGRYTEQPNVMYERGTAIPDTSSWDVDVIKDLKNNLIIGFFKKEANFLGVEETQEIIYHIGNCALRSGRRLQGLNIDVDNDKVKNDITIFSTIGYMAAEGIKNKVEKIEKDNGKAFELSDIDEIGTLEIEADLATSIPIRVYTEKLAIELADKFKNDDKAFEFKIYIPKNKFINVKIKFNEVDIEKEGVTSAYFLANAQPDVFEEHNLTFNDNLSAEFFRDKNNEIMHIAIGEGTTEFPRTVLYNWLPDFKTGTKNGIGHAMIESINFLKDIPGTEDILEPKKLGNIVRNKMENNKDHRFFNEIVKNLNSPISRQAREIKEVMISELNRQSPSLVCVYGGGSIMMKYKLEKELREVCDEKKLKLFYVPKKYAVKLEVYGLFTKVSSPNFKGLQK